MITVREVVDFVKRRFATPETFCGMGSYVENTVEAAHFISTVIRAKGVHTMVDVGCGDLNWLQHMAVDELSITKYVGVDSDYDMLTLARQRVDSNPVYTFLQSDVRAMGRLFRFDLILCRDLLLHLHTRDVAQLLRVFLDSGSRWLITNNYDVTKNVALRTGAEYTKRRRASRKLNLHLEPYGWPKYDDFIKEARCGRDRKLCLWDLARVRKELSS